MRVTKQPNWMQRALLFMSAAPTRYSGRGFSGRFLHPHPDKNAIRRDLLARRQRDVERVGREVLAGAEIHVDQRPEDAAGNGEGGGDGGCAGSRGLVSD